VSQLKHLIKQSEPDLTVRTISMGIAAEKDRIVRPAEAVIITGRSLASIWRDEQAGTFPLKIRIGQNAVGYRLSSLIDWLDSRETVTADNIKPVAPGAKRGRKSGVIVNEQS
jgi:prophage regulatory protein